MKKSKQMLRLMGLGVALLTVGVAAGCSTVFLPAARPLPPAGRDAPGAHVVRASQYAFTTDFPLDRSDPLVRELVALRETIGRTLDLRLPDTVVRITIFENRQQFDEFLRSNFPELPSRRAFFVRQGTDQLVVYACRGPTLRQDLRHEATHAILHSVIPGIPIWLDEGLAEYFENATDAEGQRRQAILLTQAATEGWRPNLARLETLRDLGQLGAADYRESWMWVRYCLAASPEIQSIFRSYLTMWSSDTEPTSLSDRIHANDPAVVDRVLTQLFAWAQEPVPSP